MDIQWRKSSYSTDGDNACLELASHEGDILIRESDEPGAVVRVAPEKLRTLLSDAKTGAFDILI